MDKVLWVCRETIFLVARVAAAALSALWAGGALHNAGAPASVSILAVVIVAAAWAIIWAAPDYPPL